MKDCMELEKHNTCQHRAWNWDKSELRCISSIPTCVYKSDFIRFSDVPPDTIMYSGNIESTGEFNTKTEWIEQFGHDDFQSECDETWYTAIVKIAGINLPDLLEDAAESQETYDDWYYDVLPDCEKDSVVGEGIKRLNEILSHYPTYMEDQRVVFD